MAADIPPMIPVVQLDVDVRVALDLAKEGKIEELERKLDTLSDRDLESFIKATEKPDARRD